MEDILFWVITTLMSLLIVAYGIIGNSYERRLKKVEERPACKFDESSKRMDKLETKYDRLEPHIMDIKVKLARIEEALVHKEDKS